MLLKPSRNIRRWIDGLIKGGMVKKFQLSKVLSVSFAHLVHDIYTSFLTILLPLLIEKLGISLTMAGLLNLIQRLPSLLNPVIGIIADKSAVRWYIILTPAVSAVGMSLLGLAPNYAVVAILLFVVGISSSFFHVPAPVLIRDVSGPRIGKGMSFYMLGGEAARTLAPLIIVAAVELWTLEGIWKLIPFALAATIFLWFVLRNADAPGEKMQKKKKEKSHQTNVWKYTRSLAPVLIAISGITFFRAMMKSALSGFLTVYLTDEGFSFAYAGILFAIFQFAGAASVLIAGTWSDRIGRIRMLQIAAVTSPLFMWLFVWLGNFWIIPLLLLLGLSIFATTPVLLAFLQEIGKERPSYVNGLYMTISFAVGAVAVVLVGFLGDRLGLQFSFEITAYVGLGAIPFVIYLGRKSKQYFRRSS
jgi:MFS transporter, FSR family, fosmidomycin resistance protein